MTPAEWICEWCGARVADKWLLGDRPPYHVHDDGEHALVPYPRPQEPDQPSPAGPLTGSEPAPAAGPSA